jgi:hypothetical protein
LRNEKYNYLTIIIIISQFNSVYIRANVTAQRPITKLARVRRTLQNKTVCTIIIIIRRRRRIVIIIKTLIIQINFNLCLCK